MKSKTANKKVINATTCEYDGIPFKSLIEMRVYKELKALGIDASYEKYHYTLQPKFHTLRFWHRTKKGMRQFRGVQDIQYTPDFEFTYNGVRVFVEVKGFMTDRYMIVKKLWLRYLLLYMPDALFFEIKSVKDLRDSIALIASLCKPPHNS